MGLTNRQYDLLEKQYQEKRRRHSAEREERKREAYARIPGLEQCDSEVPDLAAGRARELLLGNEAEAAVYGRRLEEIRENRRKLLAAAGLPADYLEMTWDCPLCHDTGYVSGERCICRRQASVELLFHQYPLRDRLREENFRTFSFDYFDREEHPRFGKSSFDNMKEIYDQCRDFCSHFEPGGRNLVFEGQAGTGKTFLSNCIAEALLRGGHEVVYLSAGSLFERLAAHAFHSDEENTEEYERILDCELLIIDDLGTELNNSFVSSQLFFCLNERRQRRRSTLISTNLSINQIRDAYTERVSSRIMEDYEIYHFFNSDIRVRKRCLS